MVTPISRREGLQSAPGAAVAAAERSSGEMPKARFWPQMISRLIVGGNPASGNSHVSGELSREMASYWPIGIYHLRENCRLLFEALRAARAS